MNTKDNIDFVFKYLKLILNMETQATAREGRKTTRKTAWDTTNKHTNKNILVIKTKKKHEQLAIGHHKSGV